MKNILNHFGNFCMGGTSTLIILSSMGVSDLPPEVVEMIKALISMLGGLLSTLVIWILNRLVQKYSDDKKVKINVNEFRQFERKEKKQG